MQRVYLAMNSMRLQEEAWFARNVPRFEARQKGEELELEVMDIIGAGMFFDGITGREIKRKLDEVKSVKHIRLLLNTPGGDVAEGLAIANILKRHPAKVTAEVVGESASAGTVAMLGADKILMHEGTYLMIHEAATMIFGMAGDLEVGARTLRTINEGIVDLYERRTGKSRDELIEAMARTTYMSTKEAIAFGLADDVIAGTSAPGRKDAPQDPAGAPEAGGAPEPIKPTAQAESEPVQHTRIAAFRGGNEIASFRRTNLK